MVISHDIAVSTPQRCCWIDITPAVQRLVAQSGIKTGICVAASMHTTAGITVNENADPDVGRDIFWKLNQLIPPSDSYRHAEGNSDSHLKASLIGLSVQIPIRDGILHTGTWQSIYFCEFDGPRSRIVAVTIIGE